jgi:RNA polymerase sigma factor (sigma-70 family)
MVYMKFIVFLRSTWYDVIIVRHHTIQRTKGEIAVHRYDWLEDLHAAHYATLLRLAQNRLRRLTGNIDDAEDVVQDAFLLAAEKDIRRLDNPLAWLMKTTSNLCLQRMDRAKRDTGKEQRFIQHKLDNSADRSVYAVERQESETDILLWMLMLEQSLSPDEWELLRKYCLEGVPIESLAAELDVPVNRLKVKIHRIRKKLEKIRRDV